MGSLGHCWVSARHLGGQWYQGPAGLGSEVAIGWAAGGLATLEVWPSEISGLRALVGSLLPPVQGHLLTPQQDPQARGAYEGGHGGLRGLGLWGSVDTARVQECAGRKSGSMR